MVDWNEVFGIGLVVAAVVFTAVCIVAEPCGAVEASVAMVGESAAAIGVSATLSGSGIAAAAGPAILAGTAAGTGNYMMQNAASGSDSGSDCADQIANGHAYNDHIGDFPGVRSRSDFAQVALDVMKNGISRGLRNGRTAFFDEGRVVIRDPSNPDGGSMYRASFDYFLGLP